jgi:para-nitrobenzyl esterase
MGTPHAMEITYKFYNVPQPGQQGANPVPQSGNTGGGLMGISRPESVKAAHNMAELWSSFARTGKPAAKAQPEWPAYTPQTRATMEIDADCKVVNDPYPPERQLWERLDP